MGLQPLVKDRPLVDALRFVREHNRALLGVSMVLFAMDGLTCFVSRMAGPTLALIVVFGMLRALVRGFLRPGLLRSLDSARRGEDLSVDELTSGFDCFESAIGAHVVTGFVVFASLVVGGLPGLSLVVASVERVQPALFVPGLVLAVMGSLGLYLYGYAGVRFSEHVVALERLGTMAAVSRSWKLARGKRLRILYVVFIASTLELGGLLWGLAAFGVGMFFSVPYLRLAGDHALLGMFTKLQAEDRAQISREGGGCVLAPVTAPAHAPSAPQLARTSAVRGASLPEYALLLVAIVLMAAGAFRALGTSVSASADKAASVLKSGLASAGGSGPSSPGALSPLGGFLSDFTDGLVKGDFSNRQGIGKVAGQIVGGFIPIYGQIAAARDAGAAIRDIAQGKKDGWQNLGLAAVGFVPGVGNAAKAGLKGAAEAAKVVKAGEEVAAVAKAANAAEAAAKATKAADEAAAAAKAALAEAEAAAAAAKKAEDAAKAEQFGEGASSKVYRDGDNVKKVVKDEVAADGGNLAKITPAERDFVAKNTVEVTNQLHDAMPGIVPKMTSPAPGVISQPFVEGKSISQLNGAAQKTAKQQMKDAIAKAHDTVGLDHGGHGEYPNGFLVKVDPNSANFRFDPKGNITSWFDPVSIVPPASRGAIPGIPHP